MTPPKIPIAIIEKHISATSVHFSRRISSNTSRKYTSEILRECPLEIFSEIFLWIPPKVFQENLETPPKISQDISRYFPGVLPQTPANIISDFFFYKIIVGISSESCQGVLPDTY